MGVLDAIIGGAINFGTSVYNQKKQEEENERQREFAAAQQEDSQAFNAAEAQKNRDFQSVEASIARDFNAAEAQKNRDFQSAEAEAAYERQVDFYEQYQSIGSQVQQYKEAGLNPALLAGGVSVGSTPSSFAASGSSATASAPSGSAASSGALGASVSSLPQVISLAEGMLSVEQMKTVIENMKKEGNKIEAETDNIKEGTKLTTQQVVESVARVNNLDADTLKIADERAKIAKDIAVSDSDIALKQQQVATLISQSVLNDKKGELITEQIELTKGEQRKLDYVIEDLIADTQLTKRQAAVAQREYYSLIQEYGHQEVMNAITEITASRDTGAGPDSNGYYRTISEVKRFFNSLLGWWSGTTNIDVPHKKPAKIGFK